MEHHWYQAGTANDLQMLPGLVLAGANYESAAPRASARGSISAYGAIDYSCDHFPASNDTRLRISRTNGGNIAWARDSRELFPIRGTGVGDLYGITVQPGSVPTFGAETRLFDARPYCPTSGVGTDYDMAPDGGFLMITRGQPTSLTIVTHWIEQVRAKVLR